MVTLICRGCLVVLLIAVSGKSYAQECRGEQLDHLLAYVAEYDGTVDRTEAGAIVGVSLPLLRIQDAQLPKLAEVSSLSKLDLSSYYFTIGEISDVAIHCLSQLGSLKTLSLSGHTVSDEGFVTIGKMKQLVDLNLIGVPITNAGFAKLGSLTKLRSLKLGQLPFQQSYRHYFRGFLIDDNGISVVSRMPRLEALSLYGTDLSDAVIPTINRLRRLKTLNLGFTNVSDKGLSALSLPQLESLILDGTLVEDIARSFPIFAGLHSLGLRHIPLNRRDLTRIQKESELRRIWLGDTGIDDANVQQLSEFNLLEVDLSGTRVTDIGLSYISRSRNLESLLLDRTKVSDVGLNKLGKLSRLRILSLNNTAISGQFGSLLSRLPSLNYIDVSDTKVGDCLASALSQHPEIETVIARNTSISSRGLTQFRGEKMRELDLSGANVDDAGLQNWIPPADLETLKLAETGIRGYGFKSISSNKKLSTLAFGYSQVDDESAQALMNIVSLRELGATGVSGFTDKGLGYLKNLTSIHTLELAGTSISDQGISLLANFDRMHCFDLAGTKVTANGLYGLGSMANVHSIALDAKQVVGGGISIAKQNMAMFFELYLVGEGIDDLVLAESIDSLAGLRELALFGTGVTNFGLQLLSDVASLHTIRIAGGETTRAGVERLRGKLPHATIVLQERGGWWLRGPAGRGVTLRNMP